MLVSTKLLGSRKPLFEDFSVTWPPNGDDDNSGGNYTLREVIERVVRHEVQAFRERQASRQFIRALSKAEIDAGGERGKIEMGGSEVGIQSIDEEQAVANALVSFEDGIYLVAIDDIQYLRLDQAVFMTEDSRLTFIRLAMLSGA